jgi:4'-phosphopantetheinyl transferase
MLRWLRAEETDAGLEAFAREGLGPAERARLAGLRFPRRRRDWLLGRLAAKRLLARVFASRGPLPPALLEVRPDARGAPWATLAEPARAFPGVTPGERLPVALAISHSRGRALCAALSNAGARRRVGCDIEKLEPRSPGLVHDFFDEVEIAAWEASADRDLFATTVWSAKESVLKALGLGLGVDTRHVRVRLGNRHGTSGRFSPFEAAWVEPLAAPVRVAGFWREAEGWVETLAVPAGAGEAA